MRRAQRIVIEQEDKDAIVKMYNNGIPMGKIAVMSGYSDYTVKRIIKDATGMYQESKVNKTKNIEPKKQPRRTADESKSLVLDLYINQKKSIEEIIAIVKDLGRSEIEEILTEEHAPEYEDKVHLYKVSDLPEVIKNCNIGDKYKLGNLGQFQFVTIEAKYKHCVKTDKGYFTYIDLLMGGKVE